MTIAVLDRPTQLEGKSGPDIWVDEAIWGHRLHDEQSPWLTFLEFLNVLQAEHTAGRALQEATLNSLSYRPQNQLKLRNLVFNNPHIMTVLAEGQGGCGGEAQRTLLPMFTQQTQYHAGQQVAGKSPDGCATVARAVREHPWPS